MKKMFSFIIPVISFVVLITSCNTATPEEYFDRAVLNTNMFTGFAGDGFSRQLASPSAKMGEQGEVVAMPRSEVINDQIKYLEEQFEKVKGLKETADAKDILQSSIALYNYILPVYKNEYKQLAILYDEGAAKEKIAAQTQAIHDKYFATYNSLYQKLISNGKLYATKHAIKVNWNDGH